MRLTTILIALLAALAGSAAPLGRLRRQGVPLVGRPSARLPDGPGRHVHGQADQRAHRRQEQRQGVRPEHARVGEGHDRADQDRRARHGPRQRGAVQQHRARHDRSLAALPVQVERSTCGACSTGRSATRSWPPWRAQGFIGLAFYDSGSRSFYSGKKAIKNVADTKGMKIRVQQSDMWVAMMQAIGANATPLPYAEVYTALKTGVVDAAENNWPSYKSSRHYEAAKIYSLTEHSMAPEDPGLLQEDLGRAVEGGPGHHPHRRQGIGALHAQAVGRARGPGAQDGRGRGQRRSSPTSTRSRSPTPWRRSTPSSRPIPSCRIW